MNTRLLTLSVGAILLSCSRPADTPTPKDFELKLSYGIGRKNVLDTFNKTYTKDLIDSGAITVPFVLGEHAKAAIWQKMIAIDFFAYPDTFKPNLGRDYLTMYPHWDFDFRVLRDSTLKQVFYRSINRTHDPREAQLEDLISLIRNVIESSSEYRALPQSHGGYY